MEWNRIISVLVFFLIWQCGISQTFQINGAVRDAKTGELLIGATIIACNEITASNSLGEFELLVDQAICDLVVSYVGYELFQEKINLSIHNEEGFIVFLNPSANILDQAVITASKVEQKQANSTVTLEVIQPKFIESARQASIDGALDLIPGVDIIDGQANIRGGSGYSYGAGSRVLLVIDEMPALQFDGGFPNWDDVPVERVARVEVLKGASSVLYGSSALNGVIHVKTESATKEPTTKAGVYYRHYFGPKEIERQWWDSSNTPFETNAYVTHQQKINKLDVQAGFNGTILNSFNESTYDKRGRVTLGLKYYLKPKLHISLNTNFNLSETQSFFYWGNAFRKSFQAGDNTLRFSNNFRYMLDPKVTFYDKRDDRHVFKGRMYSAKSQSTNNQSIQTQFYYSSYNYFRNFDDWNANLVSGIEQTFNSTFAELYGNAQYTGANLAGFLQWNQAFFKDRLHYNVGVRYEWNQLRNPYYEYLHGTEIQSVQANTVSERKPVFRSGINYQLGQASYFRGSIGQAYRYPTIAEKFTSTGFGGFTVIPNPDLESETGWSAELGFRQEFKVKSFLAYFDIAFFRSEYQNMMEFGLSESVFAAFQAQNIGDTRIEGLEASTAWQCSLGALKIQALLAYTFIEPTYQNFDDKTRLSSTEDINILKYRYKHSVKSNLSIDLFQWSFWMNQRYNSHMVAIDRNFETFIPGIANFRDAYNTGYNIWSFTLDYSWRSWKFGLNLDNAFNVLYTERPGLLEAPRNMSLKVSVEIN